MGLPRAVRPCYAWAVKTPETDLKGVPKACRGGGPPIDARRVFELMVKARVLEERLITMSKSADGYFWIGGPGEEAFNVPLGLLVDRGEGPAHDYLHLHYRSLAIMLAMGMPMIEPLRQMASRATDPFTGGRNFIHHYAIRSWNVVPGSSTIETQYAIAPGTALAQRRHGGRGLTIVNGGDAGTAEGDFATCLNWSSRPGRELPVLMIVVNNQWGISTSFDEVHGDRIIARRAEAFGIRWDTVNGNDPEASWNRLSEIMAYVREERKPFCLEAYTSRLHGHSSSSGAARNREESDCVEQYEEQLLERGVITEEEVRAMRTAFEEQARRDLERVRGEPIPDAASIHDHTFCEES